MTAHSAVDEGRNPYGEPNKNWPIHLGANNQHRAWLLLLDTPCKKCGATTKQIIIKGNNLVVTCSNMPLDLNDGEGLA